MNLSLAEKAALFAEKKRRLDRVPSEVVTNLRLDNAQPILLVDKQRETKQENACCQHSADHALVATAHAVDDNSEARQIHRDDLDIELITRFQAGDRRCGERLLLAHEGLVRSQTKGWIRWYPSAKDDILQEARMGLLRAFASFDQTVSTSLVAYAIHWIRHRTQRFVEDKLAHIRIPNHLRTKLRALRRTGAEPSSDFELAGQLALQRPVYLDSHASGSEEGRTLAEIIPSGAPSLDSAVASVVDGETWERILSTLSASLTERERVLIRQRYAEVPLTLEAIADNEGVVREAVRQRELVALRKLRRAAKVAGITFEDICNTN